MSRAASSERSPRLRKARSTRPCTVRRPEADEELSTGDRCCEWEEGQKPSRNRYHQPAHDHGWMGMASPVARGSEHTRIIGNDSGDGAHHSADVAPVPEGHETGPQG